MKITEENWIKTTVNLNISTHPDFYEEIVMKSICQKFVEFFNILDSDIFKNIRSFSEGLWGRLHNENSSGYSNFNAEAFEKLENYIFNEFSSKYNLIKAVDRPGKFTGEFKSSLLLGDDLVISLKEQYEEEHVYLLPSIIYYTKDSHNKLLEILTDLSKFKVTDCPHMSPFSPPDNKKATFVQQASPVQQIQIPSWRNRSF